ncbi:MAG: hypothetical protein KatS3mg124_1019 [Porticoccaceae bacterium]|nr:MAG: hypothetical protein KatS3mg124_1019 [Porticoccaceae bacterium]
MAARQRWGAALLALAAAGAAAEPTIYRHVDRFGNVTFTDRKLGPDYQVYRPRTKGWREAPGLTPGELARRRAAWHQAVVRASLESGMPVELLHAVIGVESAYQPRAVSRAGAMGLMQLMPATARRYGVADPFAPEQNLRGGARYLRDLLARYGGRLDLALAAYNAGEGAVDAHGGRVPPYAETRAYVAKVLEHYRLLRLAHSPRAAGNPHSLRRSNF